MPKSIQQHEMRAGVRHGRGLRRGIEVLRQRLRYILPGASAGGALDDDVATHRHPASIRWLTCDDPATRGAAR